MSGLEALKALHADPLTGTIPAIAVTASAMAHDIKVGMDSGFLDYVTKPIHIGQFERRPLPHAGQRAHARRARRAAP